MYGLLEIIQYMYCKTFGFIMSYPAMSLGDRFCVSRNGGTGGSRWVHLKGTNSMALSGLGCEKLFVGAGQAISLFLA